jgi:hypothetical protein
MVRARTDNEPQPSHPPGLLTADGPVETPQQIRGQKLELGGPDSRLAGNRDHPLPLRDGRGGGRHSAARDLRPGGLNAREKRRRGCGPRDLLEGYGQWPRSEAPHAATALGPAAIVPSSTRTSPPPADGAPGT